MKVTTSILLNHNGLDALEKLIALKKLENSKFSKNYIAKKIGLRSRSYLTDIFKGRKKLAAKYINPVISTLNLAVNESLFLEKKLLLETEFAKPKNVYCQIEGELKILEKNLKYQTMDMDNGSDIFTLSLVYLSFFLFEDRTVSFRELLRTFDEIPAATIEGTLHELIKKELIQADNDKYRINPENDFSFLKANYDIVQEIKFLKQTIIDSERNLFLLKESRDEVVFHSSLLTVKKSDYESKLKKIREDLRKMHCEIEDENPDTMVRFNVQVFPVFQNKESK